MLSTLQLILVTMLLRLANISTAFRLPHVPRAFVPFSSTTVTTSVDPPVTYYTIPAPLDDSEDEKLISILRRNYANKADFISKTVIPGHTRNAFSELINLLASLPPLGGSDALDIVLDMGCGTAMSCNALSALHPNHYIIGIDKSIDRLSRGRAFGDYDMFYDAERRVILLRADINPMLILLRDYLLLKNSPAINITHLKLYYPNPYPVKKRMSSRTYAHPSFALLLGLGIESIEVRSNWPHYIKQFVSATATLDALEGRMKREIRTFAINSENDDSGTALKPVSRFEEKYMKVGERCHGVVLTAPRVIKPNS